jgi:hypothetical protein
MFTSAMNGTGGVQYHDASPNVTLYKQGSKAWRTSNRGLIKADLIAWQNGAIGSAEGVAVFADTGASERALRASVNDFISSGDPSVEDVLKAYVPGYVPAPPPDDEGGVRIEPHTALPAEDPAAGKADKLAATIAELIEYTPGIIEVLTLEELAAADTSGSNVLINGRTAVHADSGGTLNTVDICKTKKGKKCKPVVYNNVAKSGDTANAASTVFINGQPACHKSADFRQEQGRRARQVRRRRALRHHQAEGRVHHRLQQRLHRRQARGAPDGPDGLQQPQHPAHAADAGRRGQAAGGGSDRQPGCRRGRDA